VSDFFATGDADAAIARVEDQIAAAQARAAQARQLREDIDAVRGSATSPRREVTVTVDASGRLADVRLTEGAYELQADALGRLLVETANRAQRVAGEKALDLTAEVFGKDSPVVDHLRAELDRVPPSGADTDLRD
jgi:YD repeat-containing protein